jgi:PBP1b-binding outer membrane lipoprotein LpoB
MYVGVLLGAIVLAGCNVNEESEEQETEDIVNNGQALEVETIPNTDKEKIESVTPLELTQEQKENYHKQYVEIVEELNAVSNGAYNLEVEPIDKFKPEDWVEPEKFRQLAEDRATWNLTNDGDPVE